MSRREGSALEDFFGNFVPMLHSAVRDDNEVFLDDPTMDLDRMEVAVVRRDDKQQQNRCQPQYKQGSSLSQRNQRQQPQRQQPQQQAKSSQQVKVLNETYGIPENRDCSIKELRVIVEQLQDGDSYGQKLLAIMLKGLEKTLSPDHYRPFVENGPPSNWIPIVKMNSDNTPFVEFLIKSDLSDQDPFSQLTEYSAEQMALCAYILNHLKNSARENQLQLVSNNNYKSSHQQQQQKQQSQEKQTQHLQIQGSKYGHGIPRAQQQPLQQQQQLQQPKKKALLDKNQRSSLPVMTTSTPLKGREAMAKRSQPIPARLSVDAALNDSKRVLPPRKCKANTSTGSYRC